jgi:Ca2+-binding RTX toxin-like protein
MLQLLESRRLLSAAVHFDPLSGTLEIYGTAKSDDIQVTMMGSGNYICAVPADPALIGSRSTVEPEPGTYVGIAEDGKSIFYEFFGTAKPLSRVILAGDGGDDVLRVCSFATPVEAIVYGDQGNDEIHGFQGLSTPVTALYGGDGDDVITALVGREADNGFFISGDADHDLIFGSNLDDVLYGDGNWDMRDFIQNAGDDTIFAGQGDDVLFGGDGVDALYGEAGNDYLVGGGGIDLLDGGDGFDIGVCDQVEKVFGLEQIIMEVTT